MSVPSEKPASSSSKPNKRPSKPERVKPAPWPESEKPTPSKSTNGKSSRADFVEQQKARRRSRSPPYVSDDPLALIRKRELARLLGVNPWTLDLWRKRGTIPPPVVLSPQVLAWRRSDISEWLAERQARPVVIVRKKGRERSK